MLGSLLQIKVEPSRTPPAMFVHLIECHLLGWLLRPRARQLHYSVTKWGRRWAYRREVFNEGTQQQIIEQYSMMRRM